MLRTLYKKELDKYVVTLRVRDSSNGKRPVVAGEEEAAAIGRKLIPEDGREHVLVLILDVRQGLMGHHRVSIGSLSSSIIHPREAFRVPLMMGAASIILVHNHPSGDPAPSAEDHAITARLKDAGDVLGMPLTDHIVLGGNDYRSFKKEGWIYDEEC